MRELSVTLNSRQIQAVNAKTLKNIRIPVTVAWTRHRRCSPYEPYYTEVDGKLYFQDEYGEWHPFETIGKFQVGDTLRVRETWCHTDWSYPKNHRHPHPPLDDAGNAYAYKADYYDPYLGTQHPFPAPWMPTWISAVTMPRQACRIKLKITSFRVEKLNMIIREDIRDEGIILPPCARFAAGKEPYQSELHQEYGAYWDAHHNGKQFKWTQKPWVWVLTTDKVIE